MIVNGEDTDKIALADRGLQYGDGSFTTMAVHGGKIAWYKRHISRLITANKKLHISFTELERLESVLSSEATRIQTGIIKVIITRGTGGRGYATQNSGPATFIVTTHSIPPHYPQWKTHGIDMGLSPITLAQQPLLAGIKHLNRLEQVFIKQQLDASDFTEVIVCDTDGFIVEASMANLFWRRGNVWYTPDLSKSGIDGVMRNVVMDYLNARQIELHIVKESPEQLSDVDELIMCNSVMGLIPVNSLTLDASNQRFQFDRMQTNRLESDLDATKYAG